MRIIAKLVYRNDCPNSFKSLKIFSVPCQYLYQRLNHATKRTAVAKLIAHKHRARRFYNKLKDLTELYKYPCVLLRSHSTTCKTLKKVIK